MQGFRRPMTVRCVEKAVGEQEQKGNELDPGARGRVPGQLRSQCS